MKLKRQITNNLVWFLFCFKDVSAELEKVKSCYDQLKPRPDEEN